VRPPRTALDRALAGKLLLSLGAMRTLQSMRQGSLWMRLFPALWMRWAISIIVGAAVIVGLVEFIDHNNGNSEAKSSPKALARENQEARVIVGADQAPHSVMLRPGQQVGAAFVAAVRADIRHRLRTGDIEGRLQNIACHRAGARAGRTAYRCVAQIQDVKYPFVGVFTTQTKRITYCKRDPAPVASQNIPVSPGCTL
jgi:hypothetical protein